MCHIWKIKLQHLDLIAGHQEPRPVKGRKGDMSYYAAPNNFSTGSLHGFGSWCNVLRSGFPPFSGMALLLIPYNQPYFIWRMLFKHSIALTKNKILFLFLIIFQHQQDADNWNLPCGKQGILLTWSIIWLLLTRRRKEPGYELPWYWGITTGIFRPQHQTRSRKSIHDFGFFHITVFI